MVRLCWTFTLLSTIGKSPHPHSFYPYFPPKNQSKDTSNFMGIGSMNMKTVQWSTIESFNHSIPLPRISPYYVWRCDSLEGGPTSLIWLGLSQFYHSKSHVPGNFTVPGNWHNWSPYSAIMSGSWASSTAMTNLVSYCQFRPSPSLSVGTLNWGKHTENRSCLQHNYVKCSSLGKFNICSLKSPGIQTLIMRTTEYLFRRLRVMIKAFMWIVTCWNRCYLKVGNIMNILISLWALSVP